MEAPLPFSEGIKEVHVQGQTSYFLLLNNGPPCEPSRRNGLFPHFPLSISCRPVKGRYVTSKGKIYVLKRPVLSVLHAVPLFSWRQRIPGKVRSLSLWHFLTWHQITVPRARCLLFYLFLLIYLHWLRSCSHLYPLSPGLMTTSL